MQVECIFYPSKKDLSGFARYVFAAKKNVSLLLN
jgi:hypothetical protein